MFAFEMNATLLEEYYRRAKLLGAITEEQKTHILLQMCKEGLITNALHTNATKAQFIEAVNKYFNVKYIGDKNELAKESEVNRGETGTIGN